MVPCYFSEMTRKNKKNLWYELPVPAVRNLVILMVTTTGLLFQRCNDSEFPTFCSGRKQVTPQKNSPCWYHSPKVHFQKKLAVMKIYDFDNWHVWLGKRNLLKNKQETTLAAKTQPGLPWTFWRNQFRGLCEEIGKGTWNHRKPGLPTGVFNVNSTIFYRNLNDMSFFRALYIYMYINIYLKKNIFLVYIYICIYDDDTSITTAPPCAKHVFFNFGEMVSFSRSIPSFHPSPHHFDFAKGTPKIKPSSQASSKESTIWFNLGCWVTVSWLRKQW